MPGADPGSGYPGQRTTFWAPIATGFLKIRQELFRGSRMPYEMKEQQVLKIDPDPGGQAAGIRTPGTCHPTQIVQKRKN